MGLHEPFLHKLVPAVVADDEDPYPELHETAARVAEVIEKEEENFFGTIDAGLERIERTCSTTWSRKPIATVDGGRSGSSCTRPTACRPSCSRRWRPSTTSRSTGTASASAMEEHGETSGKAVRVFKTGPHRGAQAHACTRTEFLGYETDCRPRRRSCGIVAAGPACASMLDEVGHERPDSRRARSHAVLRRERRPGGRHRRASSATRFQFEVHRHAERRRPVHPHRPLAQRRDASRRKGHGPASTSRRRQGIRRAHSATHILHYALAKDTSARTPSSKARRSTTTGCGSTSPTWRRCEHEQLVDDRKRCASEQVSCRAGRTGRRCRWPKRASPGR